MEIYLYNLLTPRYAEILLKVDVKHQPITNILQFDMVCDKGVYRSHLIMTHHIVACFRSILASMCADM